MHSFSALLLFIYLLCPATLTFVSFFVSPLSAPWAHCKTQGFFGDVFVMSWPPCLCPSEGTNTASPFYKAYTFGGHTYANSARLKNSRDLIVGGVVFIAIIYLSYPRFLKLFIEWLRFSVLITCLAKTENTVALNVFITPHSPFRRLIRLSIF